MYEIITGLGKVGMSAFILLPHPIYVFRRTTAYWLVSPTLYVYVFAVDQVMYLEAIKKSEIVRSSKLDCEEMNGFWVNY